MRNGHGYPSMAKLSAALLAAMLCIPWAAYAKIPRSAAAKHEFQREHPCPSTGERRGKCPGYVIDHVIALKRGGADSPSNMQWQTKEEAKAKDRWE